LSPRQKRDSLNPLLKNQLEKATPKQRVALFAAHGIWYEALTASAKLHRTDSKDTDWATLLQSISMADLAPEPITECCKLER